MPAMAIKAHKRYNSFKATTAKSGNIGTTAPGYNLAVVGTAGGTQYQNSTMEPAIALAGRVPVKVTDENGMLKAGDLITTSGKKGYGMKCKKAIDCVGAVVGIAMQNQKESNEVILMMVR